MGTFLTNELGSAESFTICLGQDVDTVCEARGVSSHRNERLSCLCTTQQDLSGSVFDMSSPGIGEFISVTQPPAPAWLLHFLLCGAWPAWAHWL